jgi:hypothetical protein
MRVVLVLLLVQMRLELAPPSVHQDAARPLRFKLKIDSDGSVTIEDAPKVEVERLFGLPCPRLDRECLRRSLADWYADPYRFQFGVRERWMSYPPVFGARFDLNEWLMRARREDPRAREKQQILEGTREERFERAQETRPARTADALVAMSARLRVIWRDDSISVAERRSRLFQLWDECDEGSRTGVAARHLIIRFIRELAPAGSAQAYDAAELERLNRGRSSQERFAPYD